MIILNTTFVMHHSVVPEILPWISGVYGKSASRHGAVPDKTLLTKVLVPEESANYEADFPDRAMEDVTYALHLYFPDMPTAVKWNKDHGSKLFDLIQAKYGLNILMFHTFLLVI